MAVKGEMIRAVYKEYKKTCEKCVKMKNKDI